MSDRVWLVVDLSLKLVALIVLCRLFYWRGRRIQAERDLEIMREWNTHQ